MDSGPIVCDEYANRIPKYTKVKVLRTQDKHMSAEQLSRATLPPAAVTL